MAGNEPAHVEDGADPLAPAPPLLRLDQLRLGRVIFGIVSLGVAIAYFVGALAIPVGNLERPGPGMWPFAVGIGWIVISLLVIFEALLTRQVEGAIDLPVGIYRRDVIVFAVATVGYVILLPLLGQYAAASLYCVTLVKFLGRLPWWRAVLYGLALAVGISWIFLVPLQVNLPDGLLPEMLGF